MPENLIEATRRHQADNEEERVHQDAILDWLRTATAPLDRNNYNPGHATGSALILSEQKRVALIFHSKLQLWVQPGGHAESGETDVLNVASREASEELGIAIGPDQLELFDLDVHRIAPTDDEPVHKHFDFRFLAVVEAVDLEPGSDAEDAQWFTRSQLGSLGLDPGLRRMADKAVARNLLIP
ncbi:MAG: NUDIX domain-containing protein [Solirubrobacterales bacterium]